LQNQYSELLTKNSSLEKTKVKMQNEIDILAEEVEKVSIAAIDNRIITF